MTLNEIDCKIIASNLIEPTTLQIDEERNVLYVLTGYRLTRIDLTNSQNNSQNIYQHNRQFQGIMEEEDDYYSQGESDEEEMTDPYEDSEPSTDDDEDQIENRRNWRRYGWRIYQLDNPCSILVLEKSNQIIILNEGVITFLTVALENDRAFVQGSSKNIFCYDFNIFNQKEKQQSIQPWSIVQTSIEHFFIFSLLDDSQLYSLDIRNENPLIEQFTTTSIDNCPYLFFHPQSNKILVYNSTEMFAISLDEKTTIKIDLVFIEQNKTISAVTCDQTGDIYILSNSTIFKCIWKSQLELVESLGKIPTSSNYTQMIVTSNYFYLSDVEAGCIHQWTRNKMNV